MSVLIKTMMMPDSCHVCMAGFAGYCFVAPAETDGVCPDHGRADWCPIIELPDHGDLIDRDKLLKKKMKMDAFVALEWVSDVDICLERAVIPAERE